MSPRRDNRNSAATLTSIESVDANDGGQERHAQGYRKADGTEIKLMFSIVDTEIKFPRIARQRVVNTDSLASLCLDIAKHFGENHGEIHLASRSSHTVRST